jgi:putative transcription factor
MPPCELCGKEASLVPAIVEGSQLQVCAGCGKYGNVLKQSPAAVRARAPAAQEPKRAVEVESIVSDYGGRIRAAREKRGLSQKDFSRLIAEKESLISKLEAGQLEPTLLVARKLERLLGITLVERQAAAQEAPQAPKRDAALTIGDIAHIRERAR